MKGSDKMKIEKNFHLDHKDFMKLVRFVSGDPSYKKYVIVNIRGKRVMIFHSDSFISKDRCNTAMILLFHKLFEKGKVDQFCCCYPEETAIPMELCFMGKHARGEIHHSGDSNMVTFTCSRRESR